MTPKILTLIPVKPNLHPRLKRMIHVIADNMELVNSNMDVVFDESGKGDAHVVTLEDRVAHTCGIRNNMVKKNLTKDYSHVFWVDADIIGLDPTIPGGLLSRSDVGMNSVIAPKVMIFDGRGRKRFYDTAGFVTPVGKCLQPLAPHGYEQYASESSSLIEMNGVGCVYMVPANVYRAGAQHEARPGFTDHLAVCEFAKMQMGMKVMMDTSREVFHAWLPHYGEKCH